MTGLENVKQYVGQLQADVIQGGPRYRLLQSVMDRINLELSRTGQQLIKTMSKHHCPACFKPLSLEKTTEGVWIWCAHGSCEGRAANAGAYGNGEDEAFQKLERAIEEELERSMA